MRTFEIVMVSLPIVWSPSSGGVVAGVRSDADAAGATCDRMVWSFAARSATASTVTARMKPTSSRETTSIASWIVGIRFVRVLANASHSSC